MKPSLKIIAFAVLCAGSLPFVSGCAATSTRQSTGEYVDDAAISTKVKTAFVRDEAVKAIDVKVETFKGVVQLSGFVDTAIQKERAGSLAGAIPGVLEVKNNITVK
ncbi:MAG TPA: BON domain-containing protein [Opitutaceae bacterium]|nr:BON domain-containing protein [Opitutaceae bacterium]